MLHHLTSYRQFQSVGEMDSNVRQHINDHSLTKSQLRIIQCIASHALATPGVAHLKAETIAKKLAISAKTVYRAVKYLQQLGIIQKVAYTKLNGIKAANIYIICPYVPSEMSERDVPVKACQTKPEPPKTVDESISFESKKSSKDNLLCKTHNRWHIDLQTHFSCFPLTQHFANQVQAIIPKLAMYNKQQFERAKKIITDCVFLVANQHITIYSSFENFVLGAYKKWILRTIEQAPITDQHPTISTRPVPFYNWLDERE
ncbi:helix-turn-helix domain-containing protein [Solibacillus sp. MA9]|uniref:Helix-turn-helix domain-containing protein n=1 Tax=Solibacillus palustris TaxID=2908203 RepID=A0ABS9UB65_9BACL|nr:helix-turn-helix domain-containing protein [Solibacillus sp. MA9]MCH7321575.1 helix-turn-helix domain-containing protein [Solibacillus sp. MA9]